LKPNPRQPEEEILIGDIRSEPALKPIFSPFDGGLLPAFGASNYRRPKIIISNNCAPYQPFMPSVRADHQPRMKFYWGIIAPRWVMFAKDL
jgi:hypothetical protein